MVKISFLFIYLGLTLVLISLNFAISLLDFPLIATIQSITIFAVLTGFFITVRKRLKPSLMIYQKTIQDVAKNDLTLDEEDLKNIESLSNFTLANPRMFIKYTNLILQNQNTILQAAKNDRDFISRNEKLRDTIIDLNHSIITTEKPETLLDEILKTAVNTIEDSDAGTVLIPKSDGSAKYVSAIGMDLKELQKINIKIADTFVYKLNKKDEFKPIIVRDKIKFSNDPHPDENNKYFESSGSNEYPCSLSAPIILENTIYGVLCLDSRSTSAFDKDDIRMMEYFTSEMAIVIKNSRLINKAIQLSRYDSLTNIHNRHFFEEIARMAFEGASRYKGSLHIVLFDLDNFKTANDSYGHSYGDQVLQKFSSIISKSIRGSDVFARFGGDEFIALFRNSDTNNVEKRIEGIKKELDNSPIKTEKWEYTIKFSYGIAGFPDEGVSYQELVKAADANMYKNKEFNKKEGKK